jgi:hypothetical protein
MIPIKHDRNSGYFIWVSGVVRGKKNKGAGIEYSGTLYCKIVGLFSFSFGV